MKTSATSKINKIDSVLFDLEGTMQKPLHLSLGSDPVVLVDGVSEGIKKLAKEFPLFIVSNCGNGMLQGFLNFQNMRSYFKDWECLGNSGKGKDENIKDVVTRNNLQHPIYVGDSFPDKGAAERAGVPYIHAAYGLDGFADDCLNFDTFSEVVKFLLEKKST